MVKFQVRIPREDLNRIKLLAGLYTGGNISKWIRHAAIEAPRWLLAPKEKEKKK